MDDQTHPAGSPAWKIWQSPGRDSEVQAPEAPAPEASEQWNIWHGVLFSCDKYIGTWDEYGWRCGHKNMANTWEFRCGKDIGKLVETFDLKYWHGHRCDTPIAWFKLPERFCSYSRYDLPNVFRAFQVPDATPMVDRVSRIYLGLATICHEGAVEHMEKHGKTHSLSNSWKAA